MAKSIGPACGNNPNFQMSDGDRKAVDDFKARLALKEAAKPYIERAAWVDFDPLMEVIAATVWKHCGRDDENQPQLVRDDPRTIAAFAAAVARAHATVLPPPADRAAVLEALKRRLDLQIETCDRHTRELALLRRLAAEAPTTETCRNCKGSGLDPRHNGEYACPDCPAAEAPEPATQAEAPPVCEGFQWIGQSFATCDRCGQPAWDHVGEDVAVEGAGPFDNRRTVRPWEPGEADRIRAKWGAPAAAPAGQTDEEASRG